MLNGFIRSTVYLQPVNEINKQLGANILKHDNEKLFCTFR